MGSTCKRTVVTSVVGVQQVARSPFDCLLYYFRRQVRHCSCTACLTSDSAGLCISSYLNNVCLSATCQRSMLRSVQPCLHALAILHQSLMHRLPHASPSAPGSCQLQVVTTVRWLAALQLLQIAPVYTDVMLLGVFSCIVCTCADFAS